MLEKWRNAVPRKDRLLETTDVICEKHFEESCIDRQIFLKNADGSVLQVIQRQRPKLKVGAVPTIFPNCKAQMQITLLIKKMNKFYEIYIFHLCIILRARACKSSEL